MSKKNFKRVAAFTMVAALTAGSAMTALAADGVGEGTGSYEGTKEGAIPTVSVTLPTETELQNIYNYVADPNDLIKDTADNGRLGSSVTVDTNAKGILFNNDTDSYAGTSKLVEVESENYQDVDITVELKVKDGAKGDASIVYADSAEFDADDTAKKLYLAVTDGAASDPETAALSASGVVKLTQTVAGVPGNYTLKYDTDKYVYAKNDDASGWNNAGFALTGAINQNAEWGEGVTFPTLQVTWSFAEHRDSYLSSSSISSTTPSVTMTLPSGVSVSSVKLNKVGAATPTALASGNTYTVKGATLGIKNTVLSANVGATIDVTYSDGHIDTLTIE